MNKLTRDQMIGMYKLMVVIRKFEYATWDLYTQGLMPGLAHLYIGEEAVAVGACSALRPDDYITSTHRGHGHLIAKGGNLNYMMAEILGKSTGYCKGKGGSMHIADIDLGILGANGIVGGGLPIATGAALSAKMMNNGRVVLCFFGDGATNQGAFHESMNLASVWKLPIVFVCENNLYGISVSQKRHQNISDVAVRSAAYGVPGTILDGNDVIAVYEGVSGACRRARAGEGPTLVECKTYRWGGHHVGDPNYGALYRSKEEIEQWKQKCPVKRLRDHLEREGVLTAQEFAAIEDEAAAMVEAAVEFAKSSPFPEPGDLRRDVFVDDSCARV